MVSDNEQTFEDLIKSAEAGNTDALAAMLVELQKNVAELAPTIELAQARKDAIESQKKAKRKELDDLATAANDIENSVWDTRKKMREIEAQIKKNERLLTQANANKQAAIDFARLSDEFDKLTAGAKWREWAYDFQVTGAKRLAGAKRAILADKMGLGKTISSLIYLDMVQAKKVLVVCPNDVTGNFLREVQVWAPHRQVVDISGVPKGQRDFLIEMLNKMEEFILIVNYEINRKDKEFVDLINSLQIDSIICDESHNIKTRKTAAYKMVKAITQTPNCCPKCQSGNICPTPESYAQRRY